MPNRVVIRWCEPADIPALQRYYHERWKARHILSRDEELLRWQFDPHRMRLGAPPGPSVLIAWLGGEIIGTLGVTGLDLCLLGQTTPAVWIQQWHAAPEHRKRNVGLKLLGKVTGLGYEAILGLGVTTDAYRVLRALRYEIVEGLHRWVGVFDSSQTTALLAQDEADARAARALCDTHTVASSFQEAGKTIAWGDAKAHDWNGCWDRLAADFIGAARDCSYLQWRYLDHPRFDYRVELALGSPDGVSGLLVYRIEGVRDRNERVMRIVELLAEDGGWESLVNHAIEAGRRAGVAFADFYCTSTRPGGYLEAAGFRREDPNEKRPVFPSRLQPLEPGVSTISGAFHLPSGLRGRLPDLIASGQLYVTKSDADQDRPN